MAMNHSIDRVRFLSPVTAGSRVRATTEITGARASGENVRLSSTVTVEIEGGDRPALVAELITPCVPEG